MRPDGIGPGGTARTTCPYCGVGCGVLATPRADGRVDIKGDPDHPANFGRLCSKGSALGETLSLDDRALFPLVGNERASWNDALDLVAKRFSATIDEYGPDSVAFYVSGQILTEDYYVANKLMKGFIGSANIDTNSRLCMASSVAGHRRAFGSDTVPGIYEDLELADLVVLVGSNLAWCHPVLYQRLAAAKAERGTKVVVIDPRVTATCDIADMHLALTPGSDVALFNGLLAHLVEHDAITTDYIQNHTNGFDDARAAVRCFDLKMVSSVTGLDISSLKSFYDLFRATPNTVTVYSQGVNQSIAGTDKVNAIINCHLATGRIGKPGMGPFSVTGQPNAMGGREVGGLANMLAAHMELENPAHRRIVQDVWTSPTIASKPGLKAVDMFQAVADGRIKAIWIMATNPVDSMPDADAVAAALSQCPFVVVSDVTRHTDTTRYAHVVLPSAAWGEKDGTVTNSERRISRQRAFLPLPGETKPDWWQMAEVAKRMGFGSAFSWTHPAHILAEYARLTTAENNGARDLDLEALADVSEAEYAALSPVQWPCTSGRDNTTTRFFADGQFFTPDRKARFVPTPYRAPAVAVSERYPFVLNTGRIRDQWHTMTRTAKSARLSSHISEPFVEIHPDDAALVPLKAAEVANLQSPFGQAYARVLITERQQKGSLFAPIHWTDAFSSSSRVGAVIAAQCDPISGQPELKAAPVSIAKLNAAWYGFSISRSSPSKPDCEYWCAARCKSGWRQELAGSVVPADWQSYALAVMGLERAIANNMLSYNDKNSGQFRCAVFDGSELMGLFYAAREPVAVSRTWATELLDHPITDLNERMSVLAGRGGIGERDRGSIVCSCFDVGANDILTTVRQHKCTSVSEIGTILKAGTNCGSCRPEIARLLRENQGNAESPKLN